MRLRRTHKETESKSCTIVFALNAYFNVEKLVLPLVPKSVILQCN